MKKIIFFVFLCTSFTLLSQAQIKTVTIPTIKKEPTPYDSTKNSIEKYQVEQYIGQTLYLPKTAYEKDRGFNSFKCNLKGYAYKPIRKNDNGKFAKTKYEAVAGKYFLVTGVERDTHAYINDVYLCLKEIETGEELFYDFGYDFPFIVQGYFEKIRYSVIGRDYIFNVLDIFNYKVNDIITENAYLYDRYMEFRCIDCVLIEESGAKILLILENINKSKIQIPYKNFELLINATEITFMKDKIEYENNEREKKEKIEREEKVLLMKKESLERAKALVGKTIFNYTTIVYTYDVTDNEIGGKLEIIEKYIPLKVIDAEMNKENSREPVRLIFENMNKQRYYIDINFDQDSYSVNNFNSLFSINDIRKQYPHITNYRWNLIKQGRVCIGMSKDECKLSWGSPNDINKTVGSWGVHEQWVYDSSYLYFENGKLTSMQY